LRADRVRQSISSAQTTQLEDAARRVVRTQLATHAAARGHIAAARSGRDGVRAVIRLQLRERDLERLRFAYSPLAEVAESLYVLHSGQIPILHRAWYAQVSNRLRTIDMARLGAIVPAPRPHVASFLLSGAREPSTSIEVQLSEVAACSPARLRADLEVVWRGEIPPEARRLLAPGGAARIAESLSAYWRVAIEPFWPQIRAVLDADVTYRAGQMARGGIEAMLCDLHPDLELADHAIQVQTSGPASEHELHGDGLLLVPCVFAWPHVMLDIDAGNSPSITYAPRGISELWPHSPATDRIGDPLADLLGRSRAAILRAVATPKTTSDLADELDQSRPAVSAQLGVLRRAGLVSNRRVGRRVLYQLTPLADSVIAAGTASTEGEPGEPA
jgi:DNA-binding transcriptional ArsR family regulator